MMAVISCRAPGASVTEFSAALTVSMQAIPLPFVIAEICERSRFAIHGFQIVGAARADLVTMIRRLSPGSSSRQPASVSTKTRSFLP